MLGRGRPDAVEVQRSTQRLAEQDEALEIFSPMFGLARGQLRRFRPGRFLLVAPVEMEDKHHDQQDERRHEREPALALDVAHVVQAARDRGGKHDHQRSRQRGKEQRVLAAGNLHDGMGVS